MRGERWVEQNIRLDQKARVAEEVVLAKPAHGEQMLKATLAPQTTTLKKNTPCGHVRLYRPTWINALSAKT